MVEGVVEAVVDVSMVELVVGVDELELPGLVLSKPDMRYQHPPLSSMTSVDSVPDILVEPLEVESGSDDVVKLPGSPPVDLLVVSVLLEVAVVLPVVLAVVV